MNIVYYSSIFFTDCDFPLIRTMQNKGNNVLYIIEVIAGKTKGALFNIVSKIPNQGVIRADELAEFKCYSGYIDLSKTYIVIRTSRLYDFRNWTTYVRLCLLIKTFHPQVVHSAVIPGLSESLLYLFKKKMLLTVHDPFVHSGETSKLFEIKRKIAFRIIPKLVLLNKKQLNPFIETYRIQPRKVYINSLGVYDCLNYLSSQGKREKPINNDYILFFGHISPYKGIEILCEAMKEVHKHIPNLSCIIAGNGKIYFDFTLYEKLNYIKLINQYIAVPELANLISNSLFVVCPYKDATQSGVVFSSFAFSKPVIATDVGGMSETIKDGETGLLVPPNNVMALSDSIIKLYNNPQLLQEFKTNISNNYIVGEDSWDNIADIYIRCYKN